MWDSSRSFSKIGARVKGRGAKKSGSRIGVRDDGEEENPPDPLYKGGERGRNDRGRRERFS